MAAAAERGLCVMKPWGETAQYDFIVEHEARYVRVQVKSTTFKDRGGYSCSVRPCRGAYVGNPFDFVAVYVIPEDVWFIIPEAFIREQRSVAVYPKLERSKFRPYQEAWGLLKGEVGGEAAGVGKIRSQRLESKTEVKPPPYRKQRDKGGAPLAGTSSAKGVRAAPIGRCAEPYRSKNLLGVYFHLPANA